MKRKSQFLIFTDLDGTFLDHRTYSPEPARGFVRTLDPDQFSIIPVTSKTRSETRALVDELELVNIFVTENGSAIHAPDGFPWSDRTGPDQQLLGENHARILRHISDLPATLRNHLTGFSDMTPEQVAAATGLPLADATRARQREASEPFSWSGTEAELELLREAMAEHHIALQQGGRFYHLTGECGKSEAVDWICRRFQSTFPDRQFVSLALGDGPNDLAMIECTDYGVIIPNAAGQVIQSSQTSVMIAQKPGPEGWVQAVRTILAGLERA